MAATYTYEDFKEVLSTYNKLLALGRSVSAGYDYSNVNHTSEEKAYEEAEKEIKSEIWAELKRIGIKSSWALEEALFGMGIDRFAIFQCQEVNLLDENGYLVSNKNYAKEIGGGFTFDDCYCLKFLLEDTSTMVWGPFDNAYNTYMEKSKAIKEKCSNYGKLVESLNKDLPYQERMDIRGYSDQKLVDQFEKDLFNYLNKKFN